MDNKLKEIGHPSPVGRALITPRERAESLIHYALRRLDHDLPDAIESLKMAIELLEK